MIYFDCSKKLWGNGVPYIESALKGISAPGPPTGLAGGTWGAHWPRSPWRFSSYVQTFGSPIRVVGCHPDAGQWVQSLKKGTPSNSVQKSSLAPKSIHCVPFLAMLAPCASRNLAEADTSLLVIPAKVATVVVFNQHRRLHLVDVALVVECDQSAEPVISSLPRAVPICDLVETGKADKPVATNV